MTGVRDLGRPQGNSLAKPLTTPARGESIFAIPGTYSWTCPVGVTSVSVVCVGGGGGAFIGASSDMCSGGGGGLAYKNNISVTPGQSYTITVGVGGLGTITDGTATFFAGGNSKFSFGATTLCEASGGKSWQGSRFTDPPGGGVVVGDGGGSGGVGRADQSARISGGGAAGYSGNGGDGAENVAGASGSGGGGASGSANVTSYAGGSGGVGVFGQGTSGTVSGGNGLGGSGGQSGEYTAGSTFGPSSSRAGLFGAGGSAFTGSTNYIDYAASGAGGAVRIVWPGNSRKFPSTDVGTP